jgi:hypothetical protein
MGTLIIIPCAYGRISNISVRQVTSHQSPSGPGVSLPAGWLGSQGWTVAAQKYQQVVLGCLCCRSTVFLGEVDRWLVVRWLVDRWLVDS